MNEEMKKVKRVEIEILQEFVKDTKWAHIDIAGTAYLEKPQQEFGKGASGAGVRTLLSYITK